MKKRNIVLTWTKRSLLSEYRTHPKIHECGLYVITRVWGENSGNLRQEKILYIGKSSSSFQQRLDDHTNYWTNELRGNLYVRFACLNVEDDILEDIESALIYECQPQENTAKMRTYSFRTNYLYKIENCGFRGVLPKVVDASEHLDE